MLPANCAPFLVGLVRVTLSYARAAPSEVGHILLDVGWQVRSVVQEDQAECTIDLLLQLGTGILEDKPV